MKMEDKEFSPQESLQLIRSMIETTKSSFSDHSHFFLLWGWATLIGCVLQYILLVFLKSPHHYNAWLITPVALVIHMVFIWRVENRQKVRTFIGEAMGYVWTIIGLSFAALAFVFSKIGWQYSFPFYIMLYAIGTYISGCLLKFKPMKIGGLICVLLVVIASFVSFQYQILLCGLAILISYIIPGHILRNRYNKNRII